MKPSESLSLMGVSSWTHPSLAEGGGSPGHPTLSSFLVPSHHHHPMPLLFLHCLLLLLSHSVMSDSLQPNGLQQARLPILHYLSEFAKTHVH